MQNSVLSSIYIMNWGYNHSMDDEGIDTVNNWEPKLRQYGDSMFLNEEWKQEFWDSDHYNKLY